VTASSSDTLGELKLKICAASDIDPASMRLLHNDTRMTGTSTERRTQERF
jgi:hypothetical protein